MSKQPSIAEIKAEAERGAYRLLAVVGTYGRAAHDLMVRSCSATLEDLGEEPSQLNVLVWAGRGSQRSWDAGVADMVEEHGLRPIARAN